MKVAILGVGTTAMIVADIILESHNFTLSGFVGVKEERERLLKSKIYGNMPFLGEYSILSELKRGKISNFIAAIGDNMIREEMYYEAIQCGLRPINAISRNAIIQPAVTIGKGVIVSPGAVISHGAVIGDNCIFDPSVVVDVNTEIGPNCYFYPNVTICGGCVIEKNVTFEAGSVMTPGKHVGKNQRISAGQVVNDDLEGLYRED